MTFVLAAAFAKKFCIFPSLLLVSVEVKTSRLVSGLKEQGSILGIKVIWITLI